MHLNWRQIVLTTLAVASVSATAASRTLDGAYLSVTFDDTALPADFTNVRLQESVFNWTCGSDGACAPSGPVSAAIVFGSTSGQPVAVTSQALNFGELSVLAKAGSLIAPSGANWGVATADIGKWSIGVDIASQNPPVGDPQFASAYGQFAYSMRQTYAPGAWLGSPFPPVSGRFKESKVLGLHTSGLVSLGFGGMGPSTVAPDGTPLFFDYGFPILFSTQLDGARYALPSSTDVHCSSTTCMEYKTGYINVNSYILSFDVVTTPFAVPEPGTFAMMGLGFAALSLLAARRRRV